MSGPLPIPVAGVAMFVIPTSRRVILSHTDTNSLDRRLDDARAARRIAATKPNQLRLDVEIGRLKKELRGRRAML